MITLKFKYEANDEVKSLILKYQRQYSSCLHFIYNRIVDSNNEIDDIELRKQCKQLKNIDLIDSFVIQCALMEAKQIYSQRKTLEFYISDKAKKKLTKLQIEKKERLFEEKRFKVIFGGKKTYFNRQKGLISESEWQIKKLNPFYVMGDRIHGANRKFRINDDLETITFHPSRKNHYEIKLLNIQNRYNYLKDLYKKQVKSEISISYKIDQEYVYISFDEDKLYENKLEYHKQTNRVLGIDLNPNYIGWTIVDWKSESEFKVIVSGVYSLKELNNKEKEFNKLKLKSNDKRRIWLNNKRNYETIQIVKDIVKKAISYNCELISIEDLNIKSKDRDKGKNYNKLVNNVWLRNTFTNNLIKRCNILGIKLLKVLPQYSSFIGNFIFRSLNLPDMCLSAIELSRRCYEYYNQYITKKKEEKKNIVYMDLNEFKDYYLKSLEEFEISAVFKGVKDLYKFFKEKKKSFEGIRLSVDSLGLQFSRWNSKKSLIKVV